MSDPDDEPTREDAFYASLLAAFSNLFHGNWFFLALIGPLALIPQVVNGTMGLVLVASTWLVIGTAYWAVEYKAHGVHTLWAIILILVGAGVLGGLALLTLSEVLN
jgi:hypothetical protein